LEKAKYIYRPRKFGQNGNFKAILGFVRTSLTRGVHEGRRILVALCNQDDGFFMRARSENFQSHPENRFKIFHFVGNFEVRNYTLNMYEYDDKSECRQVTIYDVGGNDRLRHWCRHLANWTKHTRRLGFWPMTSS